MVQRWTRLGAIAALGLGACLLPAEASAQCATNGSPVTYMGVTFNSVIKYFTMTRMCALTASNNAACFPTGMASGLSRVSAMALTAAVSPTCAWQCSMSSCSVAIDGSDGLPVELLDFEIVADDGKR